jgi:tRNA-specific 2-thiouridylase
MTMTVKKILVAMSGGVDSSVAALLLKEAGHEVTGATIRTWAPKECSSRGTQSCCGLAGVEDARRVADQLGIQHLIFNFEQEFKELVMDHFAAEYMKGRTPNPCISCNEHIKFRLFWQRARQLGFGDIATGHYAQVGHDDQRGAWFIAEGCDRHKDQSYVLFPLDQELLAHLHLPVGQYTKQQIRDMAREKNLTVWNKADSQEICFVPDDNYGAFLKERYLHGEIRPGIIRMKDGREMGRHEGFFNYTRGQRRGLGVAWMERLYVVKTDPATNEVILGLKPDVCSCQCTVKDVRWFLKPVFSNGQARVHVKIRSQHKQTPAVIELLGQDTVRVDFDEAQEAITSGQAAVFYEGSRVLGGGWIDEV